MVSTVAVDRTKTLRPGVIDIANIVDSLLTSVSALQSSVSTLQSSVSTLQTKVTALETATKKTVYDAAAITFESGFEQYDTGVNDAIEVTLFGNYVFISGAVRVTTEQAAGTVQFGRIRSNCRPAKRKVFVQNGSGQNKYCFMIYPNGTMWLSRYGVATNIAASANAWLRIDCAYALN